MKTCLSSVIAFTCLSAAFVSTAAIAETSSVQGGTINFTGAIVEAPCDLTTDSRAISMRCQREGQPRTSRLTFQQANAGQTISNPVVTTSMRYINPTQTLAIMTVSYK